MTRAHLIGLSALSTLATAAVIAGASGRSPAQLAALAALRHPPVIVRHVAMPPAPVAAPAPAVAPATAGSGAPAAASSSPSTPVPASIQTAAAPAPADAPAPARTAAPALPKVGHLFEIALDAPSYAAAFGSRTSMPYLRSLARKGTLLTRYRSLTGSALPDRLAMISGQAPNPDTRGGCPAFAEFPATAAPDRRGELDARGCVYPETVITLGDQITAKGHVWRAYIEGMGTRTCPHPDSNASTATPVPGAGETYDLLGNPFAFFHSLLDLGGCASDDVDLTHLPADLGKASRTATFSYLAPGRCATTPTTTTATATTTTTPYALAPAAGCPGGQPAELASENAFLRRWVPRILGSPAYRRDGALIVVLTPDGAVGAPVRTGALVLSRFARPGRRLGVAANPYSLLRSVEDMLDLTPLAHAAAARSFARAVLTVRADTH